LNLARVRTEACSGRKEKQEAPGISSSEADLFLELELIFVAAILRLEFELYQYSDR